MSAAILVTGGTGTVGRKLVRRLITAGQDVRVLSRRDRPGVEPGTPRLPDWPEWAVGDLKTGAGLTEALAGIKILVHCATIPGQDVEAAAQLFIAAARTGKPHVVYPSVIGAERIEHESYRDRRAIERLLADGDLPWTVLRHSHLHEDVDAGLRRVSRHPWVLAPAETRFQPVAADDVAERLVDLCTPLPAHQLPDLAGPELIDAVDLTTYWLRATGRKRKVFAVRKRGKLYAAYRAGLHLAPDRAVGIQTFAQYLAEAYPANGEQETGADASPGATHAETGVGAGDSQAVPEAGDREKKRSRREKARVEKARPEKARPEKAPRESRRARRKRGDDQGDPATAAD